MGGVIRANTLAVRQHRQRVNSGKRVVMVEISEDDEELLRQMKCLGDQDDRKTVGRAIAKLLAVIRAERGS